MTSPQDEELDERPPKPGWLLLAFYGDSSYQWLPSSKLKRLDDGREALAKLSQLSNTDLHDALVEAMEDN